MLNNFGKGYLPLAIDEILTFALLPSWRKIGSLFSTPLVFSFFLGVSFSSSELYCCLFLPFPLENYTSVTYQTCKTKISITFYFSAFQCLILIQTTLQTKLIFFGLLWNHLKSYLIMNIFTSVIGNKILPVLYRTLHAYVSQVSLSGTVCLRTSLLYIRGTLSWRPICYLFPIQTGF